MKIIYSIALSIGFSSFFLACRPDEFSDRTFGPRGKNVLPSGTQVTTSSTRGGLKASLDPNAKDAQLISFSEGALSGTTIAFPVGSLSISMTVSMTPGSSVNNSNLLNNLGIGDNSILSSGTPVDISSDKNVDLRNPMILAIPVPQSTSLTGEPVDRKRLAVIYRVKVAEGSDQGSFTGLIPFKELGYENGKVIVSSKYFGWFSVVELQTAVATAVRARAKYADQISALRFTAASDLPACTSADIDRLAYVSSEKTYYYCASSGSWTAISATQTTIPTTLPPAKIVKADGTVFGRVLSAGSVWRVLITEGGVNYILDLNLDGADTTSGLGLSNLTPGFGSYVYFDSTSCNGDAYIDGTFAPAWGRKVFYNSSVVGSLAANTLYYATKFGSLNYTSNYYIGSCSGGGSITNVSKLTAITLSTFPFTGAWSIQ